MKFRKKPVVIEAWELTRDNAQELARRCNGISFVDDIGGDDERAGLIIPTLEGSMTAYQGAWIIQGVNGEFYPCKADIFEKTYEAIDE